MKFTLSWLLNHLETTASLPQICEKLTAIGLEVESVIDTTEQLAPFKIAQIISAEKHPEADRLKICQVDTGEKVIQVVCGAPNARAGLKAVLALPGNVMPDTGLPLKKGTIRGTTSDGMLCAADELKLGDTHEGIIEVAAHAPLGAVYAEFAGLNDPVIEINLTPNRADCAGIRGIARDLAAAGLGQLRPMENIEALWATATQNETSNLEKTKQNAAFPCPVSVTLHFNQNGTEAPCPVFAGIVVRNIKNVPSPEWMQKRLRAIGLRPISALVDITNYFTIDLARPLHVFDVAKLKGNISLRSADGGESFDGLNGKNYIASQDAILITDESGTISLGGIMGGASTGCDENTTAVFIESAWFNPGVIARAGRAMQINSDARYRFERGVDPQTTVPCLALAARLVASLCGTPQTETSEMTLAGAVPETRRTISYNPQKCAKLIGLDVPAAEQKNILQRLGFGIQETGSTFSIEIPSWRGDVEGEADIAEEVIRIHGYEKIPATSLPNPEPVTKSALDDHSRKASAVRRALAAEGLLEAVTWSFMQSEIAACFGQPQPELKLLNPISTELDTMRPSILGNLVQACKRNADRGFPDCGLFEIGPVFRTAAPEGQDIVAATVRSGYTARHWATPRRAMDAMDAKADALSALAAAGAPIAALQATPDAPHWYHPGRSGTLRLGPQILAYFGELHPHLLAACGAEGPHSATEIFFTKIPPSRQTSAAKPLLKLENLQPLTRDYAFVVDKKISAEKLQKAIRSADKILVRDVSVFDIYEGPNLGPDKKSIALYVVIQPQDKSLTEVEIEQISTRIIEAVQKATGAVLRK